jgi:Flp pilus assembly protein TadG
MTAMGTFLTRERAPGPGGGKQAGSRRFWRDRRGAAAVEFALIAPLLLGMYFMSVEAGSAIETKRKLSRAAALIGNIVSQQESVTKANLKDIVTIGQTLLQPYNRGDPPAVTITGITMNSATPPQPTVAWSYSQGGTALTKGNAISVPEKLLTPGRFLVLVNSSLAYKPMIAWDASGSSTVGITTVFNNIGMTETHYEAPRFADVTCTDC